MKSIFLSWRYLTPYHWVAVNPLYCVEAGEDGAKYTCRRNDLGQWVAKSDGMPIGKPSAQVEVAMSDADQDVCRELMTFAIPVFGGKTCDHESHIAHKTIQELHRFAGLVFDSVGCLNQQEPKEEKELTDEEPETQSRTDRRCPDGYEPEQEADSESELHSSESRAWEEIGQATEDDSWGFDDA